MHIEVQHRPSYALAIAHLEADEAVIAEGGAMVSMDSHIQIQTSTNRGEKGLLKGIAKGFKRLIAGESFFQNTYQGDIQVQELNQGTLFIQSSSFLCSSPDVHIDMKWGGAKTFFGGEGLIMLKATGSGPVAFNAFGGVKAIDVEGSFVVDTGHIVAFDDTLSFDVGRFGGGWKSFLIGGEGLVCTFTGRGRLWIQTRNCAEFGRLVGGKLPPRQA